MRYFDGEACVSFSSGNGGHDYAEIEKFQPRIQLKESYFILRL